MLWPSDAMFDRKMHSSHVIIMSLDNYLGAAMLLVSAVVFLGLCFFFFPLLGLGRLNVAMVTYTRACDDTGGN